MEILIMILAGWVLLNVLFYLQQPGMVFYPMRAHDAVPDQWGLQYEDVFTQTEEGHRIHGWWLPRSNASHTLLLLHGNAGNISHRGETIRIFHELGLSVFIIDYSGYGKSQGHPSEHSLYADARAAWRYLLTEKNLRPENIIVFGRSLGGVAAADLAASQPPDEAPAGIILESTFSSASDISRDLFPLLSWIIIKRYRFDTAANIRQYRNPLLVIHSPEDDIIPYHLGRKVYDAANQPKSFLEITGDHNSGFIRSGERYRLGLQAFIASLK